MVELAHIAIERGQPGALSFREADCQQWHRTSVSVVEGDVVWVFAPAQGQTPVILPLGAEVQFHTWRLMDARYVLRAKVTQVDPEGWPLLGLQIIDSRRIQQREYFRVPVKVEAKAITEGPDGELSEATLVLHDISAGGLRAHTPFPLEPGTEMRVSFSLGPTQRPMELRARVVRVLEPPTPPDWSCRIGAAFIDPPLGIRERIIRFTLDVQLERRRRDMM